ncbi:hypothetical protein ABZ470_26300 [Streptosporangium sp. NPDC020072]|uniref:hypothetical protein n=1 Tax=Streptosporangium sp. NPDC020072 TaxID=3154788 RepID=UPI003437B2F0
MTIVAIFIIVSGIVVLLATAMDLMPPWWAWVKKFTALVSLIAASGSLLGTERMLTVRETIKRGTKDAGQRLIQGAGEIFSGYFRVEGSALARRGAMKTGQYKRARREAANKKIIVDPETGKVQWPNIWDQQLMDSVSEFKESRLYWVFSIIRLAAWGSIQFFGWRAIFDQVSPPNNVPLIIFAWVYLILIGFPGGALLAYVLASAIATFTTTIIGSLLGLIFHFVDMLIIRPASWAAQQETIVRPLAIALFIMSGIASIQDTIFGT